MYKCKDCDKEFEKYDSLRRHVSRMHKKHSSEVYIEYKLDGISPTCKCGCGETPEWHSGQFREYVHGHNARNNYNADKRNRTMMERYGSKIAPKTLQRLKDDLDKGSRGFGSKKFKKYLEREGVDSASQLPSVRTKATKNLLEGHYNYIREQWKDEVELLFSSDEYVGSDDYEQYQFKCKKCYSEFEHPVKLAGLEFPRCPSCYPRKRSQPEDEFVSFIESIYTGKVIRNTRSVISPMELDVYLPDENLAIEFNGIYWHGESIISDKHYHLTKTELCDEVHVNLIHVFENEWAYKRDIVESIIKSKLGMASERVYARECKVKEVSNEESKEFLENNHIQGYVPGSVSLGLYKDNSLVSLMTFCKSRYDKKIEWEMLRFCSKLDHSVVGGASRLFSHFIRKYSLRSMVTYADRRYFSGNVYDYLGFKFDGNTSPNYFYFKSPSIELESRVKYQKHKLKTVLEDFDPNKTEYQNMLNHGYDRIWDCGNKKYII